MKGSENSCCLKNKIYNSILKQDKDNTVILKNRANSYYLLKDYEASLADYTTLLEKNPKDFALYLGAYEVLKAQGKDTEADVMLNEAASLTATTPLEKFQAAKVSYYLGDYTTATTEFTSALEAGYTESYQYLGNIYLENNDITMAIYYYELYLEKANSKNISDVCNQLAYCYMKDGNYEEALTYIKKGLKKASRDNEQGLRKNEIIAYEKLGDVELALEKMEKYRKDYPEDKEAEQDYIFLLTRVQETEENSSDLEQQE